MNFLQKKLIIHEEYLKRFVEEPKDFLCEIINQLDRKCFASPFLFIAFRHIAKKPETRN